MTPSAPGRPLVIVPTYQEAENIDELMAGIFGHLPGVSLLFVDDASTDGTSQKIAAQMRRRPHQVHLLERPRKLGLASAYLAGFQWGLTRDYDAFVEMDADLSHDPALLPVLLGALARFDAVVGSRYVKGGGTGNWSLFRRFLSQFGSLYARSILGMPVRDMTAGFVAWRREVLESIELASIRSEGYAFQIETKFRAHLAGFQLHETPILFVDRRAGQSKMGFRIVLEGVIRVWLLLWRKRRLRQALLKRRNSGG